MYGCKRGYQKIQNYKKWFSERLKEEVLKEFQANINSQLMEGENEIIEERWDNIKIPTPK